MNATALQVRLLLAASICSGVATPAMAQEQDPATGLLIADGWQLLQANCTSCHSPALITQNAGSRDVWKSRIEWMYDTQGLPLLGAELEDAILDYLATNYGPRQSARRAGLPPGLMPENPYPVTN